LVELTITGGIDDKLHEIYVNTKLADSAVRAFFSGREWTKQQGIAAAAASC
jgi:hypothetical protein